MWRHAATHTFTQKYIWHVVTMKILPHKNTSWTLVVCCVANGNACTGIMSDYVPFGSPLKLQ